VKTRDSDNSYAASGYPIKAPTKNAALQRDVSDDFGQIVGKPESAGINRHVVGDERALQERSSESILTSSLAGDTARCRLKRRQGYRWAGLLSFEKPMEQDADSVPVGRKATRQPREPRVVCRSCVV
jgi:hypothetical protein